MKKMSDNKPFVKSNVLRYKSHNAISIQKQLIRNANADAPAPSWVVHPARITSLHPRQTQLTPVMVQALGKQKDVTVDSITAIVDDRIVAKWKLRGVCPWPAGDQFSDPSCQK